MADKFLKTIAVVSRDRKKQFRFRLTAATGEIIAVSDAYTRKSSVLRGIKRAYPRADIRFDGATLGH